MSDRDKVAKLQYHLLDLTDDKVTFSDVYQEIENKSTKEIAEEMLSLINVLQFVKQTLFE